MWRRTALIVTLGLALASRSKLMGQDHVCPDLLFSELNWVRFDVIMGRIAATSSRTKQERQTARRTLESGAAEELTVSIDRGLTSLHYVRESATEQLVVHVVRRDDVSVSWTRYRPDGTRSKTVYVQSPATDVSVTIDPGSEHERAYRAPSLWHFVVGQPELCDEDIFTMLKSLRPDWQLEEEGDAVAATLLNTSPGSVSTSAQEVRVLVRQLRSKDYRVRQAADRELRSRGRAVLNLLRDLDSTELDREQKLRIREIQRSLIGDHNDTPDRVAAWLINDKTIWLALMNRSQTHHREVACQHLARIVERPIEFDPTATARRRSRQVTVLRSQFLR